MLVNKDDHNVITHYYNSWSKRSQQLRSAAASLIVVVTDGP